MAADFFLGEKLGEQRAPAVGPEGQGRRAGEGVAAGALTVEALQHGVDQTALDERVGDRVERLRRQLVPGEPAVGAFVEALEGGAAVGLDCGKRGEHRWVGERPGGA
jgi:hypothetical protein